MMLLPRAPLPALAATALAATIGAEWVLHQAALTAVLLLTLALAAAWAALRGRDSRLGALALLIALAGAGALAGTGRLASLARDWPAVRDRRTTQAFEQLDAALDGLLRQTEALASSAAAVADSTGRPLFQALEAMLPHGPTEMGVVVFDSAGTPVGWAGKTRVDPIPSGAALEVRFERYHSAFEVRRALPSGRVVLASGLLWADAALPRPHRSLLARLGSESGVELRIHAAGVPAGGTELFDYVQPSPAGDRLLFSIEPVAPDSTTVAGQVERSSQRTVGWILILLVVAGAVAAGRRWGAAVLLAGLGWLFLRSPLGAVLLAERLFSPATYVLTAIRPFGSSAGHLILTGVVLLGGVALMARWRLRPSPVRRAAGYLLLSAAIPVAAGLAGGITPPPLGVDTGVWVGWLVAITLPLAALVLAGTVLADIRLIRPAPWSTAAAVAAGLAVSWLAIELWEPLQGWPVWILLAGVALLVGVSFFGSAVARVPLAIGLAAGIAAIVTWQADLQGRMRAAERDFRRLGLTEDPLAEPLLLRLAEDAQRSGGPATSAGLYLLWAGSDLAGQEFPVRLSVWDSAGGRLADVELDSLDVSTAAVASLVRGFDRASGASVLRLDRLPGLHHVLIAALPGERVLTAVAGPRTRLVLPTRLARLLRPSVEGRPPYEVTISPPQLSPPGVGAAPAWVRQPGQLASDAVVPFSDGDRHVHVTVPTRGSWMLLAYGLLAAALMQLVALGVLGGVYLMTGPPSRAGIGRTIRSFRFRLTITLAVFFIIPMVAFTAWGLSRADQENVRARDAAISAVLGSAVVSAGDLLREPPALMTDELAGLASRLESELFLYAGGRLEAASHPLLAELGLVEPLQDAIAFQRLALGDDLEYMRQASTYVSPIRVGYRLLLTGPPDQVAVLATPQPASSWRRQQVQRDLSVLLLLAVVAGVGAAVLGAQVAAQALSRPVADLERSAIAVGAGRALPEPTAPPPEFERVFAAFGDMAADIRASQAALEGARQRTAAVLARVATGVVALERGGRILLANARARAVLGAPLPEGAPLAASLPPDGRVVVEAVRAFQEGAAESDTCEVEREGRVLRLQLARLGGTEGGVVLALDDLTDVTRAARILAWGEMARQVAHEIKNPLTPIRLGVQHLMRVERERPEALPAALEETTTRILSEIERLDAIARGFSRFAAPGARGGPVEPVDVGVVVREVAGLYRMGGPGFQVDVSGPGFLAPCRADELHEVLGNLLENARNAGARRLEIRMAAGTLEVADDGAGIPAELVDRLFEPRFSTTTSGAGLGLAIVRRLVEAWGAEVELRSTVGRGTTVTIRWPGLH